PDAPEQHRQCDSLMSLVPTLSLTVHAVFLSLFLPLFFFFNDAATTEIYTLSLHDALPIFLHVGVDSRVMTAIDVRAVDRGHDARSEEHTSELQSQSNLVCRLLLEKKKKKERPRRIRSSQPPFFASLSLHRGHTPPQQKAG